MQLRWCLAALALLVSTASAGACELALGLGGTLALSADATRLGSDEVGGAAKLLTIANVGLQSATVTVSAPTLNEYPSGFDASAALVSVSYSGLLSGVQQAYTTQ
ncbi:MAG TPA: hypothetical protein VFE52_10950, partial [Devosia sp.]|nr:hypothetical protein [Devosia sp.]